MPEGEKTHNPEEEKGAADIFDDFDSAMRMVKGGEALGQAIEWQAKLQFLLEKLKKRVNTSDEKTRYRIEENVDKLKVMFKNLYRGPNETVSPYEHEKFWDEFDRIAARWQIKFDVPDVPTEESDKAK